MKPYILITAIFLSLLGGLSSCDETHKVRGRPIDIYSMNDTDRAPGDTAIVHKDSLEKLDTDD